MVLEAIATINQAVNNFVWGIPAMVCIIGVGLLLSVRTGFLQIRKFPYAIKTTIGRMFRKKDASDGSMTPFQAVCTALAGTVGTGNIVGVAAALVSGGPGALVWMELAALLGLAAKFAECMLAVKYCRVRRDGTRWGGPMAVMEARLGAPGRWMGKLFAVFALLMAFTMGALAQSLSLIHI